MKKISIILLHVLCVTPLRGQEEIIVIEDLSPKELRAQIIRVESEFYRVFNLSTEKDNLKIECLEYAPTGSLIKRRACEPNFYTDARNQNVRNWRDQVDILASPEALRSSLAKEFEELTEAMNILIAENEYFRELNNVLRMLRDREREL